MFLVIVTLLLFNLLDACSEQARWERRDLIAMNIKFLEGAHWGPNFLRKVHETVPGDSQHFKLCHLEDPVRERRGW